MDFTPTPEGVQAFIANWDVDSSTRPTRQQVETWLATHEAELDLGLGDTTNTTIFTPTITAQIISRGNDLIHTAVASRVVNTAIPERAYDSETSYGDVLWKQWTAGVAALTKTVQQIRDGALAGPPPGANDSTTASGRFPVSPGYRTRPW